LQVSPSATTENNQSTTNTDPRIPQNEWNGIENLNEGGEETRRKESESRKGNERKQDGPQWK